MDEKIVVNITNVSLSKKVAVTISSFEELLNKGTSKFGTHVIKCVVLSNGYEIDEFEVLQQLPFGTPLMLLKEGENWNSSHCVINIKESPSTGNLILEALTSQQEDSVQPTSIVVNEGIQQYIEGSSTSNLKSKAFTSQQEVPLQSTSIPKFVVSEPSRFTEGSSTSNLKSKAFTSQQEVPLQSTSIPKFVVSEPSRFTESSSTSNLKSKAFTLQQEVIPKFVVSEPSQCAVYNADGSFECSANLSFTKTVAESSVHETADLNTSFDLFEDSEVYSAHGTQITSVLNTEPKRMAYYDYNGNINADDTSIHEELQLQSSCSVLEENKDDTSSASTPLENCKFNNLKVCPLCRKEVKVLSKHLRVHVLDTEDRLALCYAQRKRRSSTKSGIGKKCPYLDCAGLPPHTRLDHHLQRKHKLDKNDSYYKRIINVHNGEQKQTAEGASKKNYSSFSQEQSAVFEAWLQTFKGGLLLPRPAKQQAYKLRQILDSIDINSTELITAENFGDLLEKWVKKYMENHECSSALTYSAVFIKYLRYLQQIFKGNSTDYVTLQSLINEINNWKRPLRKGVRGKYTKEDDFDVAEITEFQNSDIYKEALELLNSFKNGRSIEILRDEHALIRNALMITALLRNGSRCCVLANMTLTEFDNFTIEHDENYGDCYIVSVSNHKTVAEHGPAEVVLTKERYENFLTYKDTIRPQLIKFSRIYEISKSFFLTWSGKTVNSDDVIKGIATIWGKAGMKSKLTSGNIRKVATTDVHQSKGTREKEIVARHLKHRLSTAESQYKLRTKSAVSLEASNIIYEALGGKKPLIETDSLPFVPQMDADEPEPYLPDSNLIFETGASTSSQDAIPQKETRGRKLYTDEERKLIQIIFVDFINKGILPKLGIIREIIKKDQRLFPFIGTAKENPNSIKGCIKGVIDKKMKRNNKNYDN